jgi:hypothetical protein
MEQSKFPNFTAQVMDYKKDDGIVSYSIKILISEDESFSIQDRYRNMRALWEEIRRESNNPDRLPEFPPKKWFGSKSREFLESRVKALEIFFNTLFQNKDKVVHKHLMKYFKKLAKNREAKDAIQSIEEMGSGNSKPKEEAKSNQRTPDKPVEKARNGSIQDKPAPVKIARDNRPATSSKDYSEICNKIVTKFNKNLLDTGAIGADAIQEIMVKGQLYVSHFKESGINQNFKYETKLLDIPAGTDENLLYVEEPDEEIETQNDEVNEQLKEKLVQMSQKVYQQQYNELSELSSVVFRNES